MWIFLETKWLWPRVISETPVKNNTYENISWGIFDVLWISYKDIWEFIKSIWYQKDSLRHGFIKKCIYIFPEKDSKKIFENSNMSKHPIFVLVLNWEVSQDHKVIRNVSNDTKNNYARFEDKPITECVFFAMEKNGDSMDIKVIKTNNKKSKRHQWSDVWYFETNNGDIYFPK